MDILIYVLIILIFGFLVFVHELGHFVVARRNGVEAPEFGFGFPPRLYGKKIGSTIYSINWLPLGGFVKMKGEDSADTSPGSFGAASFWAKTKILFAGVIMNALTAFVILVGLCLTGLPPVLQDQFSFGRSELAQPKQVMAVNVSENSPASQAGIRRGDIILRGNGQTLESQQDLLNFTKTNAGKSVALEVRDGDAARTANVQLRAADHAGGALGVTPFQNYKVKYANPIDATITAAGLTGQMMYATLAAFGGLIAGLFTQGQVSDNVAGPVGIVVLLKNIVDLGVAYVLIFVASISISLAVINALPLPALDGGRWLLAAVHKLSGGRLSQRAEGLVHTAGFFALILLMVVVTYFDIKRLG